MSEQVRTGADQGLPKDAGPCSEGPCNEATEHVWDYLDGELSEADCAKIKAHIEQCPPCEKLYLEQRRFKETVHRACGCESAPLALKNKIVSMIAALKSEACGGSKTQSQQQSSSQP